MPAQKHAVPNLADALTTMTTQPLTNDEHARIQVLDAADREALRILVLYGALSDDDGFYQLVQRFAEQQFAYGEKVRIFEELLERISDKGLANAVSDAANEAESAKWEGAYLLGLAVGFRLTASDGKGGQWASARRRGEASPTKGGE